MPLVTEDELELLYAKRRKGLMNAAYSRARQRAFRRLSLEYKDRYTELYKEEVDKEKGL